MPDMIGKWCVYPVSPRGQQRVSLEVGRDTILVEMILENEAEWRFVARIPIEAVANVLPRRYHPEPVFTTDPNGDKWCWSPARSTWVKM